MVVHGLKYLHKMAILNELTFILLLSEMNIEHVVHDLLVKFVHIFRIIPGCINCVHFLKFIHWLVDTGQNV